MSPPASAQEYWDHLVSAGWALGMPEAERRDLRARVDEAWSRDPESTFRALATATFEADMIEGEGSYTTLLHLLSGASRGAFAPVDIEESHRPADGSVRVAFSAGGRRFTGDIPLDGSWVRPEILDLANEALTAIGDRRQLHLLPPEDTTMWVTFAPETAYERAVELGLIPAPPPGEE